MLCTSKVFYPYLGQLKSKMAIAFMAAVLCFTGLNNEGYCNDQKPSGKFSVDRNLTRYLFRPDILLVSVNTEEVEKEIKEGKYDPNEKNSSPQWRKDINQLKGTILGSMKGDGYEIVLVLPEQGKLKATEKLLKMDKNFSSVSENLRCLPLHAGNGPYTYNDPFSPFQYNLVHINSAAAIHHLNGVRAKLVVMDTGVESHDDLSGILQTGDFGGNFNLVDSDPSRHGSFVATVAAARSMNKLRSASPGAGGDGQTTVYSVRITDENDSATLLSILWAIHVQSFIRMLDPNWAAVINLSFGPADGDSFANEERFKAFHAVAKAYFKTGGLMVLAAGNSNRFLTYKHYPYFVVVGATNQAKQRAWFSNFGPFLDCAAPGVAICGSLKNSVSASGQPVPVFMSGTSFSAPQVAAICALIRAKYYSGAGITGLQQAASLTKRRLVRACVQADGTKGTADDTGAGIPNMAKAVN